MPMYSIKLRGQVHRSRESLPFSLRGVLTLLMRFFVSVLGCSFILSAYFRLYLLISNVWHV